MMTTHTILVLLLCISAHFEFSYQASPDENACTEITETANYFRRICNRYPCQIFKPIISKTITCNNISTDTLKLYETSVEDNFNLPYKLILKVLNSDIPVLPAFIFQNIRNITTLFMENVNLETIMPAAFSHLDQLKEIYLGQNKLTSIPDGIFNTLTMLEKLDVSNNRITNISGIDCFSILDLSDNNIENLNNDQLSEHLSEFVVSFNFISSLNVDTFFGMYNLTILDLDHNNLSSLPNSCFKDLRFLTFLNLSHNMFSHFEIGTFDDLLNLKLLDLSSNNIKNLPEVHSLRSLAHLYIENNDISDINIDFIRAHSSTLLYIDLNDNPWSCETLIKILRLLKDHAISVFDGNFRDGTNIRGIKCFNKMQTDSSVITTERSEFFKYLEGLNKTLNAQNIDYIALNKILKELTSKSNNFNAENDTLVKYLDNYMQNTNTYKVNENGKLAEIADSLRVIVKSLEKEDQFNEDAYNSTDLRSINLKYLDNLNAVGEYSKDTNDNYTGLLSVIAILLLINICIMVFMVYRKFFYVSAAPLKREEEELI